MVHRLAMTSAAIACLLSGMTCLARGADVQPSRATIPKSLAMPGQGWSGFYGGLHPGVHVANGTYSDTGFAPAPRITLTGSGLSGGVHFGYSSRIDRLVLGLEADLSVSSASRRLFNAFGLNETLSTSAPLFGSVRGRLGVAMDRTHLYATTGVGFGLIRVASDVPGTQRFSQTRTGFVIGAGLEHVLAPSWTMRIEYLYAQFGSQRSPFGGGPTERLVLDAHHVRVGVSYWFDGGSSGR